MKQLKYIVFVSLYFLLCYTSLWGQEKPEAQKLPDALQRTPDKQEKQEAQIKENPEENIGSERKSEQQSNTPEERAPASNTRNRTFVGVEFVNSVVIVALPRDEAGGGGLSDSAPYSANGIGLFGGYDIGHIRFYLNYLPEIKHDGGVNYGFFGIVVPDHEITLSKASIGVDYIFEAFSNSWFLGGGLMYIDAVLRVSNTSEYFIPEYSSEYNQVEFSGSMPFIRGGYMWEYIELNLTVSLGSLAAGESFANLASGDETHTKNYTLSTYSLALSAKLNL